MDLDPLSWAVKVNLTELQVSVPIRDVCCAAETDKYRLAGFQDAHEAVYIVFRPTPHRLGDVKAGSGPLTHFNVEVERVVCLLVSEYA